jgi:hypothetical protein
MNYLASTLQSDVIQASVECKQAYQELVEMNAELEVMSKSLQDISQVMDFIQIAGAESLVPYTSTENGRNMLASIGIENILENLMTVSKDEYNKQCMTAACEGFVDKLKEFWQKIKEFIKKAIGWFKYHYIGNLEQKEAKLSDIETAIGKMSYADTSKPIYTASPLKKQAYLDCRKIVDSAHSIIEDSVKSHMEAIAALKDHKIGSREMNAIDKSSEEFTQWVADLMCSSLGIQRVEIGSLYGVTMIENIVGSSDKYTFDDSDEETTCKDLNITSKNDFTEAVNGLKSGVDANKKMSTLYSRLEELEKGFGRVVNDYLGKSHDYPIGEFAKYMDKRNAVIDLGLYVRRIASRAAYMTKSTGNFFDRLIYNLNRCLVATA